MSDIKIENGDLASDVNGRVKEIEGLEEYLQRAFICLKMKRGSFCYQRDIGAYKDLLETENGTELLKEAQAAVAKYPEINIEAAEEGSDGIIFTVSTPLGNGEVRI